MRIVFVFVFWICALFATAQGTQTPFIDSSFQRTYFNPSYDFKGTINISTGLSGEISTNGPVYNDFISTNSLGNNYIDLDESVNELGERNFISTEAAIHTLDIGVKVGRFNFFGGHAWKIKGMLDYTQDLGLLIANGNAPYVGQTLNVGPGIAANAYNEIYLGGSARVENFSFGFKVKHLSGVEDVSSEINKIELTTSDDIYQIQIESDYLINTSRVLDFNDISDFTFNFEGVSFKNLLSRNTGLAYDIGVTWNLDNRLSLGLSVLDIGGITWDNAPENHLSKGSTSYEGIDIISYIGDTTSIVLEDSLYNLLQFEETQNSYSTKLPLKIVFTAHHQLNDRFTLGAILMREHYRDTNRTTIGLNGFMHLNRIISAGIQYSATNGSPLNIGLTGVLNLGPFQLFGSTDNIIAAFRPLDTKYANIRFGSSLRF